MHASATESVHPKLDPDLEAALMRRITGITAMEVMGMRVHALGEGYCEMHMAHDARYNGIFNSFHGGLMMSAADTAACWAVLTKAGPDVHLTTTDMNIRFLAPCLTDLVVKARVIKAGRTMNPCAADLYDTRGKHVAVAQVNYMLLDKMPRR